MSRQTVLRWGCAAAGALSGIILLLLLLTCPPAFATGDPLGAAYTLPERATIKVGGNRAYPPYEFLDRNGQPAGFTVDLIRSIAEVMGVNAEIRLGEWSKVREDLEAGRIDMTLGMSQTSEREETYDYPSPHAIVQHAIFARSETPPAGSLEELRGKKVVVFRGGVMNEQLKALGYEKDLVLTETAADALRLLASGQNDYAVVALLPGMYIIRENKLSNLVPVARNIATFKFSFAVKQGNHELQSQLNEGLAILKKNGEYQAIYDKWLGVLEPRRISWEKAIQYGSMILVPLVLLLTGTFVWSRMLQKKVDERAAELALEVSEKERAWEELRLQQDKLVQADKMASLGILVSGVAHEINNPNGLILLNLPRFEEVFRCSQPILDEYRRENGEFKLGRHSYDRLREELPHMLSETQDAAKRIKRIVSELKDFARRDSADLTELINLNSCVQAALRLVENTVVKSSHKVVVNLADELPLFRGNSQRIEQVIVNLLLNACQSLEGSGKSIQIGTRQDRFRELVVLTVRDEGRGVAAEHLSHLTDPFFTTKRDEGGCGLGLSISAGIVKQHGGTLAFDSHPGRGTTVTLELPVAAGV